MDKFIEFISMGIFTPVVYLVYAVFAILFIFLMGLPIAIGIHLIQMALNWLLTGVI